LPSSLHAQLELVVAIMAALVVQPPMHTHDHNNNGGVDIDVKDIPQQAQALDVLSQQQVVLLLQVDLWPTVCTSYLPPYELSYRQGHELYHIISVC
jgi:hypothetical protein